MYYKVNELNIINRKLDRNSNYLTKEEYQNIENSIQVYPEIKDLNKMLDTYVKNHMEEKNINNWLISRIEIIDTEGYDRNRTITTTIKFRITYYEETRLQYYCIKESGFRKEYLEYVIGFLKELSNKTNFVTKKFCRVDYYYGAYQFTFDNIKYKQYLDKINKNNNKIQDILEYYKDNLVEIQEDKDYLNDMNSIDEFLESLK